MQPTHIDCIGSIPHSTLTTPRRSPSTRAGSIHATSRPNHLPPSTSGSRAFDAAISRVPIRYAHGAAPNRFMTHIAIQEVDESGNPVTWGAHVTDEEYGAAPGG